MSTADCILVLLSQRIVQIVMLLEPVSLTPSGRPVLAPGEYEVFMLDKVDLEFDGLGGLQDQMEPAYKGGYVILTSTRIVWMQQQQLTASSPSGSRSCSMQVTSVHTWNKKTQLALTGTKVRLVIHCWADAAGKPVPGTSFAARQATLTLRCRGESPDTLMSHLETVVQSAAKQKMSQLLGKPAANNNTPLGVSQAIGMSHPLALQSLQSFNEPLPPQPTQQKPHPPAVDQALLRQMTDMGFPYWRSARSLLAVNNSDLQAALDHFLAFGDAPGSDEPFDLNTGLPSGSSSNRLLGSNGGMLHPPVQDFNYHNQGSAGQHVPGPQAWQSQPLQPGLTQPPLPPPGMGPLTAGLQTMQMRGHASSTSNNPSYQHISYPNQARPGYSGSLAAQQLCKTAADSGSSFHNPAANPQNGLSMNTSGFAGNVTSSSYDPGDEWGSGGGSDQAGSQGGAAAVSMQNPLMQNPAGSTQGPGSHHPPRSLGVGVGGVIRREEAKASQTGKALDTAFQDLQNLMQMAADMVALAERFRQSAAAQGGNSSNALDELMDADTQAQLIALGIASPVTRNTAGTRYNEELCRQLADWLLAGPLQAAGGLMPMTDVFCLFNRARGSELVSPDDLLAAVKLFEKVGSPMSLRKLPSTGMLVIQSSDFSQERVCARIAALLAPQTGQKDELGPPISTSDVARALNCSTILAAEHLAMAESQGVLCRDDGAEGLRFFRNFFKDIPLTAGAA